MGDGFKWNSKGYIEVMRSPGVVSMLQAKADDVRRAAEQQLASTDDVYGDLFLIADTTVGRTRAGATVIGVPMRIEARDRVLGRAIDAAS